MPFCCQCGTSVGATDQYCGKCGAAQPRSDASFSTEPHGTAGTPGGFGPGTTKPCPDLMSGVSHRTAALLCYIPLLGWIAAIIVLASDRYRRDYEVRFHAFQGLYLFVAWLIVDWVISPAMRMTEYGGFGFPFFRAPAHILQLLIFAAWIVMMIKVSHDQHYRLPIIGELAERSVSEQRV